MSRNSYDNFDSAATIPSSVRSAWGAPLEEIRITQGNSEFQGENPFEDDTEDPQIQISWDTDQQAIESLMRELKIPGFEGGEGGNTSGDATRAQSPEDEEEDEDVEGVFSMEPIVRPENIAREKEIKEKITGLKKQLQSEHETAKKLRKEVRELKLQVDELKTDIFLERTNAKAKEREMEGDKGLFTLRMNRGRGGVDNQLLLQLQKEEQKNKNLALGEVFDDDDEELGFKVDNMEKSAFARFIDASRKLISRFVRKFNPLVGDIFYVQSRYGGGIASYFKFFRWQIITMLWASLCIAIFHVFHFMSTDLKVWGSTIFPKWILYSSFSDSEALNMCLMLTIIVMYFCVTTLQKIVDEDRARLRQSLEDQDSGLRKFSKFVFNCWDHSVIDPTQVEDLQFNTAEQLRTMLTEHKMSSILAARSKKEKTILLFRRVLGTLLVIIIVCVTWAALFVLQFFKTSINSSLSAVGAPNAVISLVIPGSIAFINAALPPLVRLITDLEKWDDPVSVVKNQTVRLYFLKIFTIVLLMLQYYQKLTGQHIAWLELIGVSGASVDSLASTTACTEDEIGSELLYTQFLTFLVDKFVALGNTGRNTLWAYMRGRTGAAARTEFIMSSKVISLIYFQSLVWTTLPYCPFSGIICTPLLFFNFKFDLWLLVNHMKKPSRPWSAKDTSSFFVFFFVGTFVLALTTYYFAFLLLEHSCEGSVFYQTTFFDTIRALVAKNVISSTLYQIVSDPFALWFTVTVIGVRYSQRSNVIATLQRYVVGQREKAKNDIERLEHVIRKQSKEIARLRQRVS